MIKHGCVSRFVDLANKNLFSALDGKRSDLIAELFPSALHFRCSFGLCGLDDAVGFDLSLSLCIVNDGLSALFAVGDNRRRAGTPQQPRWPCLVRSPQQGPFHPY